MLGVSQKLLDAQFATDDAVSTTRAFECEGVEDLTHTVKWGEGVSSGEVVVEFTDDPDFAGTWNLLATFTFDGSVTPAPKAEYVRTQGAYGAVRHRISGEVLDGFVTTTIRGVSDS